MCYLCQVAAVEEQYNFQKDYALKVHLTAMQCIISPKNNTGKTKMKANRAGCDCCVESALQNKGSHNANPSQGRLLLQVISLKEQTGE